MGPFGSVKFGFKVGFDMNGFTMKRFKITLIKNTLFGQQLPQDKDNLQLTKIMG